MNKTLTNASKSHIYFRWAGKGETKNAELLFSQAIYLATVEDNLFITSCGYN